MISQTKREAIRSAHRLVADGRCAVRMEPFPCDAIVLLDDLEAVEADARSALEQYQVEMNVKLDEALDRNNELEAKILRARRELS